MDWQILQDRLQRLSPKKSRQFYVSPLNPGKWMTCPSLLQAEEGIVQGLLAFNPAMATEVGVEEGRGKRNEGFAWQLGNRPKVGGSERAGVQMTVSPRYANRCIRTKFEIER